MMGYKTTTKIPKSLTTGFLILAIFFGIDFGFTKALKPKYRIVVKVWTLLVAALVVVISAFPFIFPSKGVVKASTGILCCQCFLNSLFLFFSKITIYDFILKIYRVDKNVTKSLQNEFVGYATCFYICVVLFIKFLTANLCFYFITPAKQADFAEDVLIEQAMATVNHIPDAFSVVFVLVYYYIYRYIKKLHELVTASQINIKDVQKYFIKLADCCDEIEGLYHRLFIVHLTFETCKLMYGIYDFLQVATGGISSAKILMVLFNAQIFLRLWIPAMISQRIIDKMDAIKLALHSQLVGYKDSYLTINDDIADTLRYMDRRGLIHKIWGFIPIDVNMPLNIVKFVITYLIVIIQFTHLYDCDSEEST